MITMSEELSFVSEVAKRSPMLQYEEELELTRRFRDSRDQAAADALARSHLRLVIAIAVRYRHYGISVTELVAEGNCGLVAALHKFDPERGIRFGTYAMHWVRAHVLACVVRSSNVLGGKTSLVRPRLFFKLRRERARATALFGEGVQVEEVLAERMNLSVERLRQLLGLLDWKSVSLDGPPDHESTQLLADSLVAHDNPEETCFDGLRSAATTSAVARALGGLDPRERFIAENRIMAAADDELSLAQIGRVWGISRERVRQLEARAMSKLGRNPAVQKNPLVNEWLAD
jgi:RNA polymerase sigma-32 factor